LGGGTGSGFGSLILNHLRDHYCDKIITSFSIFPSPLISECVVEDYSVALTIPHILDSVDSCCVFDNDALYHRVKEQGHSEVNYNPMVYEHKTMPDSELNKIITSTQLFDTTSTLPQHNNFSKI
jgi:cell division GTPase FtsZ